MRAARIGVLAGVVAAVFLAATAGRSAAPAGGEALKTTEFGRGPTIVLVHGLGSARGAWLPTARRLLATNRVVMVDLPGHGDSPLPDPFTLGVAAEAIARTLAAQKAESTIVVGHGVGGVLSLMAASAHPQRVRGVVVIDAGLRSPVPVPDQQRKAFLQMLDANYDSFLKLMYTRSGRDSAQGVTLHAQAAQVPPATMKAYIRELLVMDQSKLVEGLRTPLLYVGTEKGWPADKDWPELARGHGYTGSDSLPHVRVTGAGPLIATERADTLAVILSDFASRMTRK